MYLEKKGELQVRRKESDRKISWYFLQSMKEQILVMSLTVVTSMEA